MQINWLEFLNIMAIMFVGGFGFINMLAGGLAKSRFNLWLWATPFVGFFLWTMFSIPSSDDIIVAHPQISAWVFVLWLVSPRLFMQKGRKTFERSDPFAPAFSIKDKV